ncbi:MAG: type IV secretory system conjugative DNA transfer family protein [Erysipelotrichaceae bacterium]|nr:type IV secretory system conjugative DNA transfer family protein [Erysipelotrichaceae bacterium]
MMLTILSFFWNVIFSRNARERHKSRFKTIEERRRVSRLAWLHEAKKGTQRLDFNSRGINLQNRTFRGLCDLVFDGPKRMWNIIVSALRLSDVHKFNTLHFWNIDDIKTCRRGGPPIVTRRRHIWVDAEDAHSLVVGTTRSGKTFSIVNILIQSLRMAGESMIVMDVKGELYATHGQSLIDDGYDVKVVDFINPRRSKRWNPFGIIIKKYREAYDDYRRQMNTAETSKTVNDIAADRIMITQLKKKTENNKENQEILQEEIRKLEKEIRETEKRLPKPNYSEAQELISDIAMRLCHEEDARDPFWPSSATTLLEGYINFLLEEHTTDECGRNEFLPDEMINMRSVKMLHELGKTRIDPRKNDGCTTILQYYLNHYRKHTDLSFTKLNEYVDSPDNTRGSISSVFSEKIKYFLTNEDILRMTSVSDFDLKQLGEKKTAIFIGIHDEKGTYHELPSILISQTYEELIKLARDQEKSRLKIPVYVVWDEFANGSKWENIVNALTAGLSRGVRFCLVIQDFGQLITKYGKDRTSTIRSNCQNLYYLLAGENDTLQEISKLCGTKIIWNRNKNDKIEVPVMSTDTLQKLSMGEAVIIRQRKNPYKARLLPFNRYCFSLPDTVPLPERQLPETPFFDIEDSFRLRRNQTDDSALSKKPEKEKKAEKSEIKKGDKAGFNEH